MTSNLERRDGGYLHLLPMYAPFPFSATSCLFSQLPWQAVELYALLATFDLEPAVPVMLVAYESPASWLRTLEPIPQPELEWLHVHRFRSDYALACGSQPFLSVRRGPDPPDVLVSDGARDVGLECTRLTLDSRQAAHGLFRAVRDRVAMCDPVQFSKLRGHVVYMWFNDADSVMTRPLRRNDEEAAIELVEALTQYVPATEPLWENAGEGLPETAPDLSLHTTTAGASFYCVPMVASTPDSVLYNFAGFELGLAYTTAHAVADEWRILRERIARKDRPGSEWLLISAGAPDNRGMTYPAEEALALFLRDHVPPDLTLSHLKRVTVHLWGTGEAFDIWPTVSLTFGPLYQGAAQGHRPFAAAIGGSPTGGACSESAD